jgi:hypothetical protein
MFSPVRYGGKPLPRVAVFVSCWRALCRIRVGNLSPAMWARNQVGIGLSYRPTSLCSLAIRFQTRFLESFPRLIAELKFTTLTKNPTDG